jgi:hypothetical protein
MIQQSVLYHCNLEASVLVINANVVTFLLVIVVLSCVRVLSSSNLYTISVI